MPGWRDRTERDFELPQAPPWPKGVGEGPGAMAKDTDELFLGLGWSTWGRLAVCTWLLMFVSTWLSHCSLPSLS